MSTLRPECKTYNGPTPSLSRPDTIFACYEAVKRSLGLGYGRLHKDGWSCAIGTVWDANPRIVLKSNVIDEVAAINDMFDGCETPRQRKLRVLRWLRFQMKMLTGAA